MMLLTIFLCLFLIVGLIFSGFYLGKRIEKTNRKPWFAWYNEGKTQLIIKHSDGTRSYLLINKDDFGFPFVSKEYKDHEEIMKNMSKNLHLRKYPFKLFLPPNPRERPTSLPLWVKKKDIPTTEE